LAKHIGIVACSAEGAALCYRTICVEGAALCGEHNHPEVSMHTHPLAEYMVPIRAGDWEAVAALMIDSARRLETIGAELLVCPDNTIHQAMPLVEPACGPPWLHIAREVVRAAGESGRRTLAVLGTKYLMTGPVYREAAAEAQMAVAIPDEVEREEVDRIIFDELVYGEILPESRRRLEAIMGGLKERGCDAAVLGCTELPLLAEAATAPLPLLDSTRLLARAALREAVG